MGTLLGKQRSSDQSVCCLCRYCTDAVLVFYFFFLLIVWPAVVIPFDVVQRYFSGLASSRGKDGWWSDLTDLHQPGTWTWGGTEHITPGALWVRQPCSCRLLWSASLSSLVVSCSLLFCSCLLLGPSSLSSIVVSCSLLFCSSPLW